MSRTLANSLGGLLIPGAVPTGKLLWVDQINGNDSIAVRGRLGVPFNTLGAAKNASQSGDTIVVLPGMYNEKNLLKNGVNWHFMNGANVIYSGAADGGIFDTSSNGTNAAVSSLITGFGLFVNSSNQPNAHVVNSFAANSNLLIQARSMASSGDVIKMADSGMNASLTVDVLESINTSGGVCIVISAGSKCVVRAHELYASDYGVSFTGGNLALNSHTITSGNKKAVVIGSGSGSVIIRAFEITASAYDTILHLSTSATLTVLGARIVNTGSNYPLHLGSGVGGKVKLANCTLIAGSAANSILADSASTKVQFHGLTVANKAASNVTAVPGNGFDVSGGSDIT